MTSGQTIARFGRKTLRHAALHGLDLHQQVTGRADRGMATPRVHFPYLHALPVDEEGAFRRFVAGLAETHDFISYSEAVRRVRTGPIDRPMVSFSFDDGFKSNLRAARILEEFGTVGMFFVPTGFIGTPTVQQARQFFGFVEGCDEPAMTWDDLESLRSRGHEIGNHTVAHRPISTLSTQRMTDEIGQGAETLRERLGEGQHFAWPYGRFHHFTEDAAQAVFDTGHTSCASAERGAHSIVHEGTSPALCLRRDHIMTSWPMNHCNYFIARSGLSADAHDNDWPDSWVVPA